MTQSQQIKIAVADNDSADVLRHRQQLEAVGALAGGVAHEFNNRLHAIRGYAKFAMEGLADDDSRFQDLQQVIIAVDQAAVLARQLLSFSRMHPIEPVEFAANDAVSDLVVMARPLLGEQIVLATSLASDAGRLLADRNIVQQVLLNLCINARDAMPDGGRLLVETARTEHVEADAVLLPPTAAAEYVRFSVTDSGCGLPPEVKRRIFEPFFTTKEFGKGTGMGLSMVYGSVQQHDGAISVASKPRQGSTISIYLPRSSDTPAIEAQATDKPAAGNQATILVAEDDAMVRQVAVRMLTRAGYRVLAAANGLEARELYAANAAAVSLLLLDACMPKLSGHQLRREIHARSARADPDVQRIQRPGRQSGAGGRRADHQQTLRLPHVADGGARGESSRSGPAWRRQPWPEGACFHDTLPGIDRRRRAAHPNGDDSGADPPRFLLRRGLERLGSHANGRHAIVRRRRDRSADAGNEWAHVFRRPAGQGEPPGAGRADRGQRTQDRQRPVRARRGRYPVQADRSGSRGRQSLGPGRAAGRGWPRFTRRPVASTPNRTLPASRAPPIHRPTSRPRRRQSPGCVRSTNRRFAPMPASARIRGQAGQSG